jgi:hypothetical protein
VRSLGMQIDAMVHPKEDTHPNSSPACRSVWCVRVWVGGGKLGVDSPKEGHGKYGDGVKLGRERLKVA